jgi:hypothetical protein
MPMGQTYRTLVQQVDAGVDAALLQWITQQVQNNESKRMQLRMFLILVSYYEYFCKNRSCDVVQRILPQLQPLLAILPNELNAFRIFITTMPNLPNDHDPLLNILVNNADVSQEDLTLRHVLVNLMAVVLGSGPNTDSYTRLFAMEKLMNDAALGVGSGMGFTVSSSSLS